MFCTSNSKNAAHARIPDIPRLILHYIMKLKSLGISKKEQQQQYEYHTYTGIQEYCEILTFSGFNMPKL